MVFLLKIHILNLIFYLGKGAMLDMGCWAVPTITDKDKKGELWYHHYASSKRRCTWILRSWPI